MRYAVCNGGKRLRPLLVYAVGESYGANLKVLDAPACAIEIIHSYSLVLDDLPSMDNDDLRRGKLTCHKIFDEATAILAGNALAIFAFKIISKTNTLTPNQALAMIRVLALAAGPTGMTGGQDIDLQVTSKKLSIKKLEQMYLLKTGALLCAAVKLGALAANVNDPQELKLLSQYANNVGLAFQIQDDILDIDGDVTKLGKNISSDSKCNKSTYPVLAGITAAKAKVNSLWQAAEKTITKLKTNPDILLKLTKYIQHRDY